MLGQNTPAQSHALFQFSLSLTPSAVAANVAAEQAFSVATALPYGITLKTTDAILVTGPGTGNAAVLCGARVKDADEVYLMFCNTTAGSLTPAAGTHTFVVVRLA